MDRILLLAYELEKEGCNICETSEFAEFLIARLIGASRGGYHDHHDCDLPDGRRVEIKHSKAVIGYVLGDKDRPFTYFSWKRLLGVNKSKVGNVEILVLSGYHNKKWQFWVIPYSLVKRNQVEFQISKRQVRRHSWIEPFYVGDEKALEQYFHKGDDEYRPVLLPTSDFDN